MFKITPRFEDKRRTAKGEEPARPGSFNSGLAAAWSGKNYGFIDSNGQYAIADRFDDANSFQEGLALVRIGRQFGFVDLNGELMLQPQYAFARDFSEGLAAVKLNPDNFGFVDKQGYMLITPQFAWASSFRNGLCLVSNSDSIGYITKDGEFVWQGDYVQCRTE